MTHPTRMARAYKYILNHVGTAGWRYINERYDIWNDPQEYFKNFITSNGLKKIRSTNILEEEIKDVMDYAISDINVYSTAQFIINPDYTVEFAAQQIAESYPVSFVNWYVDALVASFINFGPPVFVALYAYDYFSGEDSQAGDSKVIYLTKNQQALVDTNIYLPEQVNGILVSDHLVQIIELLAPQPNLLALLDKEKMLRKAPSEDVVAHIKRSIEAYEAYEVYGLNARQALSYDWHKTSIKCLESFKTREFNFSEEDVEFCGNLQLQELKLKLVGVDPEYTGYSAEV